MRESSLPPFLSSLSILLLSEICTENVFHYLDNNLTAAINDAAAADDESPEEPDDALGDAGDVNNNNANSAKLLIQK